MAFTIERETTFTAGQLKFHFVQLTGITTAPATFPTTIREPLAAFGAGQTTTTGGSYVEISPNIADAVNTSATTIGRIITVDASSSLASGIGFVCVIGR